MKLLVNVKKVNFVILLTLKIYRLMIPIQSVIHFVITLLILDNKCASTIGQATTRSSNYLKGNYKNSLFLIPTTPGDIIAIISCFKSKASSGHDGVSSKLVKDLRYALSFPLSIIINNSLAMGRVPDMAKLAKIIPIYKAKDKKDISNDRPISLLPIISKILEKVVHNNLYTFLEKNKVVYASQYRFRKNRSTINAITELVCHITNAIEKKKIRSVYSLTYQRLLTL